MAQISRETAKTYFETSDVPTQAQFINVLDSIPHYDDAVVTNLLGTTWDGSFKDKTLTANLALTFSSSKKGGGLFISQDGTGGRTLTIDGTAVTINSAAYSKTLVEFIYNEEQDIYWFISHTNVIGGGVISGGGTLSTPSLSVGTETSTTVPLTWGAISNATGYTVQRDTNGLFPGPVTVYAGAGLSYTDTGLTASTTYYYRIQATAVGYTSSAYGGATAVTSASGGVTYTADPLSYFARMATAGYTFSTGEKDAIQTFYDDIGTTIYGKIQFGFFNGETAAEQALDFKDDYPLTFSGTWTRNANRAKGDGSTAWADTGYDIFTNFFDASNVSMGIAVRTNATGSGVDFGYNTNGLNGTYIGSYGGFAAMGDPYMAGTGGGIGFYVADRTGTTAKLFKNGTQVDTATTSYTGPATGPTLAIGRMNGSNDGYSNAEYYFWMLGVHLTSAEILTIHNALVAYKTAMGL